MGEEGKGEKLWKGMVGRIGSDRHEEVELDLNRGNVVKLNSFVGEPVIVAGVVDVFVGVVETVAGGTADFIRLVNRSIESPSLNVVVKKDSYHTSIPALSGQHPAADSNHHGNASAFVVVGR